jgi:hypothetical protein
MAGEKNGKEYHGNGLTNSWEQHDWGDDNKKDKVELPKYYDNENGSLYKISEQRGWNSRIFDIVKRLERGGKKDPLRQEIEKSIGVLQLWLKELD